MTKTQLQTLVTPSACTTTHTNPHVCVSRPVMLTKSIAAFPHDLLDTQCSSPLTSHCHCSLPGMAPHTPGPAHDPLLKVLGTTGHGGEGPIRILSHLHRAAHQGQESRVPGGISSRTLCVLLSPAKVWGQLLRNLPPQAEPQTGDPPQCVPAHAGATHSFRGSILS